MQTKSLIKAAFILGLGAVTGCDDPEVQNKITEVMEHGSVSAELYCDLTKTFSKPVVTLTRNKITYKAVKFIDGSCMVNFCMGTNYIATVSADSNEQCWSEIYSRSNANAESCSLLAPVSLINTHPSYPFRPGVDGAHVFVEDGLLVGEFIENEFNDNSPNCGSGAGSCNETEQWFTQDIATSGCTGRNLEAFGASP